jgi:uncharacterized protein YwgA
MGDWQREIAKESIIVIGVVAILLAGYRDKWLFTPTHQRILASERAAFTSVIEEKDKTITEKDKALELVKTQYEARLREKDEECERERGRLQKSEAYTDRLITAAIDATAIATRAAKAAPEARR